jgi:hypothetical protein
MIVISSYDVGEIKYPGTQASGASVRGGVASEPAGRPSRSALTWMVGRGNTTAAGRTSVTVTETVKVTVTTKCIEDDFGIEINGCTQPIITSSD